MLLGSSVRLNVRIKFERDRILHAWQKITLHHPDAVLGRDRTAELRHDVVRQPR